MLSTFQIFYLSNNQQDRHNFLASVLTVNNIVDKVIEGYLWIAVELVGRILTSNLSRFGCQLLGEILCKIFFVLIFNWNGIQFFPIQSMKCYT